MVPPLGASYQKEVNRHALLIADEPSFIASKFQVSTFKIEIMFKKCAVDGPRPVNCKLYIHVLFRMFNWIRDNSLTGLTRHLGANLVVLYLNRLTFAIQKGFCIRIERIFSKQKCSKSFF